MVAARITSETGRQDGGDIKLGAETLVYALDAEISTSVADEFGDGGNITIDPVFVILNNSAIIANANQGNGSNILIVTDYFISGIASVVSASSALGIDGTVTIESPGQDIGEQVTEIPLAFLHNVELASTACEAFARRTLAPWW